MQEDCRYRYVWRSKDSTPNAVRAITNAKIATVVDGKRHVQKYSSGDLLVGRLENNDAPPFTGYVRNYGKGKKSCQKKNH